MFMKKIIFLLSVLLLAWCSLDGKKWVIEENPGDVSVVSWEQNTLPADPYPYHDDSWDLLSWEFSWSGKYSTILLSDWILNYDNIFTLQINWNDYNHWDYSANQNLLSWTYTEAWYINTTNQQIHNTINIYQPSSSLSYILEEDASDEQKCSISRDEWQTITKPIKYENNGYVYYSIDEKFTNPIFEEWGKQTYNYQTTLCFIRDDIVYTIIIWNSDGYKTDIKNSLRFL